MAPKGTIAGVEQIESRIRLLRGRKVILDVDLAQMYGVETRALKQAVRRNLDRFPEDFMFQVTWAEQQHLAGGPDLTRCANRSCSRSQIVTLKRGENVKYQPYAFTEEGVAMLSSVLRIPAGRSVEGQVTSVMATGGKRRRW
jgi:hypothetical protein